MSERDEPVEARDPRLELVELVAAVRAYAEWQVDCGADGLPTEAAPRALLGSLEPGGRRVPDARGAAKATEALAPHAPTVRNEPSTREITRAEAPIAAAPIAAAPRPTPSGLDKPVPREDSAPARIASGPSAAVSAEAPSTINDLSVAADERRTRLALIAEEVRSCTTCVLHEQRRQTVFSRGNPLSEIAFVGEGPGAEEDAQGLPFVGPAGQLLDRMIAAMGYHRDDVYVCNVVKCRPPNNRKPEMDEMTSCMPFLTRQLGVVRPKVLVALGATAVQGLCGTTEGITRLRGKWKLFKGSIPIMPTFHPAYLLRNPAAKREVWLDLQEVLKHLGRSPPGRGNGGPNGQRAPSQS